MCACVYTSVCACVYTSVCTRVWVCKPIPTGPVAPDRNGRQAPSSRLSRVDEARATAKRVCLLRGLVAGLWDGRPSPGTQTCFLLVAPGRMPRRTDGDGTTCFPQVRMSPQHILGPTFRKGPDHRLILGGTCRQSGRLLGPVCGRGIAGPAYFFIGKRPCFLPTVPASQRKQVLTRWPCPLHGEGRLKREPTPALAALWGPGTNTASSAHSHQTY